MILESPLIDELVMEKYGDLLAEQIASLDDEQQLKGLVRSAGSCPDLEAFRKAITRR